MPHALLVWAPANSIVRCHRAIVHQLHQQVLTSASWQEAFAAIRDALSRVRGGNDMLAIAGRLADAESLIALKDMFNRLGSSNTRVEGSTALLDADVRSSYLLNSGIGNIEHADVVLLVGANPRVESPVFNARIRKAFTNNDAEIGALMIRLRV